MDVKAKSVSGFYDDEAARMVSAAARTPQAAPAPVEKPADPTPYVPPVRLDEPQRPLLAPQPPTNQNIRISTEAQSAREPSRDRWDVVRVLAWVVLAPWYVAIAIGSVAVDFLFLKDLFGF